jgi:hypothetical protein
MKCDWLNANEMCNVINGKISSFNNKQVISGDFSIQSLVIELYLNSKLN